MKLLSPMNMYVADNLKKYFCYVNLAFVGARKFIIRNRVVEYVLGNGFQAWMMVQALSTL